MARIALTGATGFIGRHFRAWLASQGQVAVEIDRAALTSGTPLSGGLDAVVHLAGRAHVLREQAADPEAAFRAVNVELTLRLARAALAAGVRRFVFVSSAGVLGASSVDAVLRDDSPPRPHDAYTRSKLAAEQALRELARREPLGLAIVRPPLVYGPGASGNFRRMEQGIRAGWPLPIASLQVPRSLIGVRNLSSALLAAAVHPRADGGCFLVADREPASVSALAGDMARAMGRPLRQFPVPVGAMSLALRAAGRSADVARLTAPFLLQPTLIHERLGWQAPFSRMEELVWSYRPERGAA